MVGTYYKINNKTYYVFVGSKRDNAQEALHVGFGGSPGEAHRYATETPHVAARGHGPAVAWAAESFDELSGYESGEDLWDECVLMAAATEKYLPESFVDELSWYGSDEDL